MRGEIDRLRRPSKRRPSKTCIIRKPDASSVNGPTLLHNGLDHGGSVATPTNAATGSPLPTLKSSRKLGLKAGTRRKTSSAGAGKAAMNTPASAGPLIAMRGAGYYSDNTVGAKAVIDAAGDLALDAIAQMDVSAQNTFAVADFGAADGGTSLDLMKRVVAVVRAVDPDKPMSITYTDLPHNDFSVLFRRLHGLLGTSEVAPLASMDHLYTFASGTSFHRQILPDQTLSLGFSATAMHWLSTRPAVIADHVHAVGATDAERVPYRQRAAMDWNAILLARARELVPGGKLVLANFCQDEQGRYLGSTGGVDMFDAFARHWRNLSRDCSITDAEYRAGTLQQFYRTVAEFEAPFIDPASPVRQAGLHLDHVSTRVTACPYAADFQKHGDPEVFARAYIPTLRSWTESTFVSALDPSRSPEERQNIIDRFYAAYQAEVAAAPEGHGMDYVHCFMVITKATPT